MRYGGTKFHIVLRCVGYSVLLVMFFILQDSIFSNLPIFGVKPLIMPVCCAAIALAEGMDRGGAFGLACGVLCDIALGNAPIGFTILLTLIGIGLGWFSDRLMGRNFVTLLLFSLATLLVCAFFQVFNLLVFERASFAALMRIVLLQTLYSMFFTIPLIGVVHRSSARGN